MKRYVKVRLVLLSPFLTTPFMNLLTT